MIGIFKKFFLKANIFEYIKVYCKYRSLIDPKEVAMNISEELLKNDYDNFKKSVSKEDEIRLIA